MKRADLALVTEKKQFEELISSKFCEWDTLREHGSRDTTYVSDGFRMNVLRNDIAQLRNKRDKLYPPAAIPGQLTFDGNFVLPERSLPEMMPSGWLNPETDAYRKASFMNLF